VLLIYFAIDARMDTPAETRSLRKRWGSLHNSTATYSGLYRGPEIIDYINSKGPRRRGTAFVYKNCGDSEIIGNLNNRFLRKFLIYMVLNLIIAVPCAGHGYKKKISYCNGREVCNLRPMKKVPITIILRVN